MQHKLSHLWRCPVATRKRSKLAAAAFEKAGFGRVAVVDGGTSTWEVANYPVTRRTIRIISLVRQVDISVGSLVLIGVLLAWLAH